MSKIILLTGATDGIGLVTAEKLIALGHTVLIHGRNAEKLVAVEKSLTAINAGETQSYRADLSDLSEVECLTKNILEEHSHIDIVINNAGVYKTPNPITKDSLDSRFVVNTLAPYLLTQKLLSVMDNNGRVINLSSAAQSPVDLDALAGKFNLDDDFAAYAQSKLAITMWSRYMAQTLGNNGPAIIAVNPGSLLASKMVKEGFGVAGNDLNIGADILVRTSLSKEFSSASGLYFDNDVRAFTTPHPDALNEHKCEALMDIIANITEPSHTINTAIK